MNNNKALVVGIDSYLESPLLGCVNDAVEIDKLLSNNDDGTINFSVQRKTSDINEITKASLKQWIKECFDSDVDIALFYFSGHGCIDVEGGYILTQDYQPNDWGVSMQDILTIVNKSKCKNKVVILDCCHSGFVGTIPSTGQQTAVINEGVTILTASQYNESALETNNHGVFTSLLIEALKGGAADITGNISPGSIYSYIDRALGPWEQRPVFKTNVKQFVSLRKSTPPIDINVVKKLVNYFDNPLKELELNPSYEPTNNPNDVHKIIEPYTDKEKAIIFKDLQLLERVGLVVPVDTQHMYYAAMNSKSCRLTSVGQHYWRLVKDKKI